MVRNWVNTAAHGLPGKKNKTISTHSLTTESDNISPRQKAPLSKRIEHLKK